MSEVDPFTAAISAHPLGGGDFIADLHPDWAVSGRPHGGYLLALLSRTAIADSSLEPLSVSAQFLRSPQIGPVSIRVELLKVGRLVTVVRATLEQRGQNCVDATVSLGQLPDAEPTWFTPPEMPVNPPPEAVDLASASGSAFVALGKVCDVRLDPAGAGFLSGDDSGPPRLRLWVKPRSAQPDTLFALAAGDITVPVTRNLGRTGWAPSVQLTGLLRRRPANGWLRLLVEATAVYGPWFDEDALVVDSTGQLVCQARQLALSHVS